MICSKCGKENASDDSKFCNYCGNSLNIVTIAPKQNTSSDIYLNEDDNKFLDMLNIPRQDEMFVKSCKLCVIRSAMGNQISEYKQALSEEWLTDDEWLKLAKKDKFDKRAKRIISVLATVLGVALEIIVSVFKIIIDILLHIFEVICSLFSFFVRLMILVLVLAIADSIVNFSQYVKPVADAFNAVKNFVSEYYIAGLVIIGVILLAVSIKMLITKRSDNKAAQFRDLISYQYDRKIGLKRKEEAENNLEITEWMYDYATDILTRMSECREAVPPEYWSNGDSLWYLYQSRRANTVQEAINLFEKIQYQSRMEGKMDISLKMANENRRTLEEIKQISSDAREFSKNAMEYAQEATRAAHTAAFEARSAKWAAYTAASEAQSAKWAANSAASAARSSK